MNLQTAAVGLCSVFFLRQEASGLEWALKRLAVRGLSAPAHGLASEHFNMLDAQIGTLTPPMVLEQAPWSADGGPRSQGKHLFLLNKWSGSLLLSVCFDRLPHAELQIASRSRQPTFLTFGLLIQIVTTRFTPGRGEADDGKRLMCGLDRAQRCYTRIY